VLAVAVLSDVDVRPQSDGVRVDDSVVAWHEIAAAVGSSDPLSSAARRRVERLLRCSVRLSGPNGHLGAVLASRARLVALPRGHADHLGPSWVRRRLLGGALDLGIGVLGFLGDPDEVVPLPPSVEREAAMPGDVWRRVVDHAEEMGCLAVARLDRDGGRRHGVIRPVGGCDVLALLTSPTLRRWLAEGDGVGMRALAVPMRTRGWYDLAHIDPAFVAAAWSATAEQDRGVSVPLLVTADEVALGRRRRPRQLTVRPRLASP
jgi:hypothetical protein